MKDISELTLADIQPSQFYISEQKLAVVEQWFTPHDLSNFGPIPIKLLDGVPVMTDCHTRAVAALRAGLAAVPLAWDKDELDWRMYRACVMACRSRGINSPLDLLYRIVPAEAYAVKWDQWCDRMQASVERGPVLHIITSYADLDGPRLMAVYAESNRKNTDYFLPDMTDKALAVRKVEEGFLAFLRDEFFKGPGPAYYVLEEVGEWVSALRLNEVQPGLYYLEALETRPGYRRQGCAARLLREVIENLKAKGPFRLCDCVDKENQPSIRTHLACGFHIASDTGHDYLNNTDDPCDYSFEYRYPAQPIAFSAERYYTDIHG